MGWNIFLALVTLVIAWSLSRSMPVVLGGWVGRLAGRTATRLDDHLVEELDQASGRLALAVGVWLAWVVLEVPGRIDALVEGLLLIGVVLTATALLYEALVAAFEFLADPHDDAGRDMISPFESRFRGFAGGLAVTLVLILVLAVLGLDGAFLGGLVLVLGLGAILGLRPGIKEFWAGLELIHSAGWRPGIRLAVAESEGELARITPSGIVLNGAEGQLLLANNRARTAATVLAGEGSD